MNERALLILTIVSIFVIVSITGISILMIIYGSSKGGGGDKGLGQSCTKQSDCESGYTCSPDTMTCLSGVSTPCSKNDDCSLGLSCSVMKGVCEVLLYESVPSPTPAPAPAPAPAPIPNPVPIDENENENENDQGKNDTHQGSKSSRDHHSSSSSQHHNIISSHHSPCQQSSEKKKYKKKKNKKNGGKRDLVFRDDVEIVTLDDGDENRTTGTFKPFDVLSESSGDEEDGHGKEFILATPITTTTKKKKVMGDDIDGLLVPPRHSPPPPPKSHHSIKRRQGGGNDKSHRDEMSMIVDHQQHQHHFSESYLVESDHNEEQNHHHHQHHLPSEKVIDVCSYSESIIYLLKDGTILCEIKGESSGKRIATKNKVKNNISISRVINFSGYLHALDVSGNLYRLENDHYKTNEWIWELCDWCVRGIFHLSTTLDDKLLWVQVKEDDSDKVVGYIYGGNSGDKPSIQKTEPMKNGFIRVYGKDIKSYVEIDLKNKTCIVSTKKKEKLQGVYYAVLGYYDDPVILESSMIKKYREIRIVNWQPYYLER